MSIIEIKQLTKTYEKGKVIALDNISLNIEKGELYGLIGPDGAGKTTVFRLLTTLLVPDSGTAEVLGFDIVRNYKEIRRSVGYMPGKFALYQDLTIQENLEFFATLFGTTIQENYHLIRDIYEQIEPFKDRRAGKLSGGMKQKLALCCALIHKPEVLFLDEPTTGIDPVSRIELWEMLRKLQSEGITILASTPYMDEANRCDKIALIQNGKILKIDTPAGIVQSYDKTLYAVKADQYYQLLKALEAYPDAINSYAFGEYAHLVMNAEESDLAQYLQDKGFTNIEINKIDATIEDSFIEETRMTDQTIEAR